MKYLIGFGGLAAIVVYFFGGIGGGSGGIGGGASETAQFSQEFDQRIDMVYDKLAGGMVKGGDGALFTGGARADVIATGQGNKTAAFLVKAEGQPAMKVNLDFTAIDATHTRVDGTVEVFPIDNDQRSPDMKSARQIAFIMDAMLEVKATGKVADPMRALRVGVTAVRVHGDNKEMMAAARKAGAARDEAELAERIRQEQINRSLREGRPMSETGTNY